MGCEARPMLNGELDESGQFPHDHPGNVRLQPAYILPLAGILLLQVCALLATPKMLIFVGQ